MNFFGESSIANLIIFGAVIVILYIMYNMLTSKSCYTVEQTDTYVNNGYPTVAFEDASNASPYGTTQGATPVASPTVPPTSDQQTVVVSPIPSSTPVVSPSATPSANPTRFRKRREGYAANSEKYSSVNTTDSTIFDPDFYLDIGRDDDMKKANRRMKSFEDIKYSSPQDLLGSDAATEMDGIVQAEGMTHLVGPTLIGRTNVHRNLRENKNPILGDIPIAPAVMSQISGIADPSEINTGYFGTFMDTDSSSGVGQ
jgi:hypothetical protein